MLEQVAVTERHRLWVDQVALLFGGLDICAIELLVGKDGKEFIIEVNDSALSLMGDSQEEDRRQIADLVTAKMQACCRQPAVLTKTGSRGSISNSSVTSPTEERNNPSATNIAGSFSSSISSLTSGIGSAASTLSNRVTSTMNEVASTASSVTSIPPSEPPPPPPPLQRRDSQGMNNNFFLQILINIYNRFIYFSLASQSSTVSSTPSIGRRPDEPPPVPKTTRLPFNRQGSQSAAPTEDSEDTMKNLRKTFAGIFGDM